MQKKLRIIVLKHLSEKPRAGYGLIKDIHECTGWKPSYGSIYPLLDNLKQEGLVEMEEEGKKKIYHLTAEGKEEVKHLSEQHSLMITKMQDNMKLMAHMIGLDDKKHDQLMDVFFSAVKQGKMPFKEIMASSTRLKVACWELYKEDLIKKNKTEVNAIMDEATSKIEKIIEKGRKAKG